MERKYKQRRQDSKRPRITVSLDPEDHAWVESFGGASSSYTVARIVKAARLAGLTLDDATEGGIVPELVEWLRTQKKSKFAKELHDVLNEFLER
jgi:hypothetical protein